MRSMAPHEVNGVTRGQWHYTRSMAPHEVNGTTRGQWLHTRFLSIIANYFTIFIDTILFLVLELSNLGGDQANECIEYSKQVRINRGTYIILTEFSLDFCRSEGPLRETLLYTWYVYIFIPTLYSLERLAYVNSSDCFTALV